MFYKIDDCNTREFKYAYKDLSFGGFERRICEKCNREVVTMRHIDTSHCLVLEGGKKYPDLLGFHGAGELMFIVSEKTLSIFENHHISGISGSEQVDIVEHYQGKLVPSPKTVPNYHLLHISGMIELDFASMALKKKKKCDCCGQFVWNRNKFRPLILNPHEWEGSDLCRVTSIPGYVVCTEAVARVVDEYSLTGFELSLL